MMNPTVAPGLTPEFIAKLSQKLTDEGLLIEAGWLGLRLACFPPNGDAPPLQLEEMRNAFFAGAQHLFTSIMTIMDPGVEPTDADMERMDLIDNELQRFINDFSLRRLPTEGEA